MIDDKSAHPDGEVIPFQAFFFQGWILKGFGTDIFL